MDIKSNLSKMFFNIKAHSPEILIGFGVFGMIAGTVVACISTTKIPEKKQELKDNLEKIHSEENETNDSETKKKLTGAYAKFGLEMVKLYGPAVLIEGLSAACIFSSNGILKKRSAMAMAAYMSLNETYKKYRKRIAEKYGEEAEKDIRYGITEETTKEEIVDENGKKKKVSVKKKKFDGSLTSYSPFAVMFDELNPNWTNDVNGRKFFLQSVERFCNDKLRANGYLFLNEVYEELGLPKTKAGQVFGWLWRPDDPTYKGDGYVDFGIYDIYNKYSREFVNGYEPAVILDFNVDGDILNFTGSTSDAKTYVTKNSI